MAQKQQPDATRTDAFPVHGIDVENPFDLQPPFTTVMGVNVRSCEPITLRTRGGQRPGLLPYLPKLATGSLIQHLDFIVDPQADALSVDFELDPLPFVEYIDDPSSNNDAAGYGNRNNGRRVRKGGSGRGSNRNRPSSIKKTPVITWAAPADIWLGTALGAELNAQATDPDTFLSVPGVFTYTPPAGTILPIHVFQPQDLQVLFTPTNTVAYNTASTFNNPGIVVRGIYVISNSGGSFTVETGDLVLIGAATSHSSGGVTVTVSDGANTYTQIGGYVGGNAGGVFISVSLWYFIAGSPGTLTVTVTPSAGGVVKIGQGHFRGALAFDATSSGSGNGSGESFSAGVCPVNFDDEMVATFIHPNTSDSFTNNSNWNSSVGAFNIFTNVDVASAKSIGVAPLAGTSVAVNTITGGTATHGPWGAISASFTHRIS